MSKSKKMQVVVCGHQGLGREVLLALLGSGEYEVLPYLLSNDPYISDATAIEGQFQFEVISNNYRERLQKIHDQHGAFILLDFLGGEGCQYRTYVYNRLGLSYVIATNCPETTQIKGSAGSSLAIMKPVPLNASTDICIAALASIVDDQCSEQTACDPINQVATEAK